MEFLPYVPCLYDVLCVTSYVDIMNMYMYNGGISNKVFGESMCFMQGLTQGGRGLLSGKSSQALMHGAPVASGG